MFGGQGYQEGQLKRFPEFPRMKSSRNSAKLSKRSSFSLCCNPPQRAFLWRSGGLGRLGASRVARMCWTATRPQPKEESVKWLQGLGIKLNGMLCKQLRSQHLILVSPFSIVYTVYSSWCMLMLSFFEWPRRMVRNRKGRSQSQGNKVQVSKGPQFHATTLETLDPWVSLLVVYCARGVKH